MATTTLDDFEVTTEWAEIVAVRPDTAGANVMLQNLGRDTAFIVFGSATEPLVETTRGYALAPGESCSVLTDKMWVRSGTSTLLALVLGADLASPRLPASWATPTTAQDVRYYSDVEVQVVGAPAVAYTPARSLDGANYVAANAYDKDGNAVASISAAGIYSFDGGGFLKFTAGAGSTLTIRAGA